MSIQNIGATISSLRKAKGITQEELGNQVGISAQAVSKWENGGVPDIELLPKIADYFETTIDNLFGRTESNTRDCFRNIIESSCEERFQTAFSVCWDIERSLYGDYPVDDFSLDTYIKKLSEEQLKHSSIIFDQGFTRMCITPTLQYFLMVPEIPDDAKALLSDVDYTAFFKTLSSKKVFDALILLNQRSCNKSFTPKLLEKKLNITKNEAIFIIDELKKYDLVVPIAVEVDDEMQEFYGFNPTPSFVALLIFAKEMITPPDTFAFYKKRRYKPHLSN